MCLATEYPQQEEEGESKEDAVGQEGVIWAEQQDDPFTHIISFNPYYDPVK